MALPASIGGAWREFRGAAPVPAAQAKSRQTVEPVAKAKIGGVESPLWYRPPGSWTMREVEAALDAHERGEFRESGRLCEALIADDKIGPLLWNRCGAVTGLKYTFDPEPAGIREDWEWMFPVEDQDDALAKAHLMGFALLQNTQTSYDELPRWVPWPSDCVRYDIFRRQWQVWTLDHGLVDIFPGDGQWALFRSRLARPWMAALLRPAAPLMIIRQSTRFNGANHAQVYATPSRVLTAEKRMSEIQDVEIAIQRLRRLVGDSTIVLPEGLKMELLELKGKSGHEIYKWLMDHGDTCLDILFLGQSGTTKAAAGWGSSHIERRVTQDLLERDVRMISDPAHRQMLAPYDAWKRGTRDLRRVPRWVLDVTPPADKDAEAKRRQAEGTADAQQAQAAKIYAGLDLGDGQGIDMKDWAEQRGLKVVKRKLPAPVQPAAPPPAQEAAA